jgi:hypothetical protein
MAPKVKSQFIPPPTGGLNLVSDPSSYQENEARQLDNYYVYDWGIRERGVLTPVAMPDGDLPRSMISFSSSTFSSGAWIIGTVANIYKYDGTTFTKISTDPVNRTSGMFIYNKVVFICDCFTNEIHSYVMGTDTYNDTSFTGGPTSPIHGFAYKNRVYILGNRNSNLYYVSGAPGVAATSGALGTPYDVGQFFQRGNGLVWGCSWPYNQGVTNDELMVLGNDAGEVFVYSGDNPDAANWQLVARADIPSPLIRVVNTSGLNVPVVKLGQDILVGTVRGVISLQQVFAGRKDITDGDYYSVSQKLGYVISKAGADRSALYPFAYFGGGTRDVYVLNYERGVWSKFPSVTTGTVFTICAAAPPLDGSSAAGGTSLVLISDTNGGMLKLNEGATVADSGTTYTWATSYLNFGNGLAKTVTRTDVITRDMASTAVAGSIATQTDFDDSTTNTEGTWSETVSSTKYRLKKVAPACPPAPWISFKLSKTGSASAMNELAGFNAWYEESSDVT